MFCYLISVLPTSYSELLAEVVSISTIVILNIPFINCHLIKHRSRDPLPKRLAHPELAAVPTEKLFCLGNGYDT